MITQYFDINQRLVIQAPGTLAPASLLPWVYGDNYNLAIYLVGNGQFQTINAGDSLGLMLFQPAATLPEQNLAIVSAPVVKTDPAGFTYYFVNVNLGTTQLAALVQATNTPAKCEFHYIFTPASGERFSSSADLPVTVNPDPSQSAAGGTPVPPGYPTNPNVFEQIINKNVANGYAGLDANTHLNPNEIPTDTTLAVSAGKLTVVGGGGGGGNPYVAVVTTSFAVPAEGVNTPALTLAAAAPDIVANATVLITDGVSFINAIVASISGTTLTVKNSGTPGAVTGTMGANSHLYLGSTAGPVDATKRGLVQMLPGSNPTKQFYRGDDSYAQANYPDLTNIPTTFPPATHGIQHVSTGSDPIPVAGTSATGLMPARSGAVGTYLDVTGGWSIPAGGNGGNPFVGTTGATFIVPAVNAAGAGITLAAAIADLVNGMSITITDGTHEATFLTTAVSGTSVTGTCISTANSGATMANGAHVYFAIGQHGAIHASNGADPIPYATASVGGIVKPDGTTVTIASGVISVPTATPSVLGLVKPDGTTILDTAGVISVPTATASGLGLVRPDGTSITISGGVISSSGGGASDTTTASVTFNVPAINTTQTGISVANASWMLQNESYFIVGIGIFLCTAISGNTISLQNTGMPGNAASGTAVPVGALIMAAPDQAANVFWDVDELDIIANNSSLTSATPNGKWLPFMSSGTAGTGNTFQNSSGYNFDNGDSGCSVATGSSASGYALMQHGAKFLFSGPTATNNQVLVHFRVFVNGITSSLSTATDRYIFACGLYDYFPVGGGTLSRRLSFSYTDNVFSGDWAMEWQKTTSGGNQQTDSGILVATYTFYDLYLIIDPVNIYYLIGVNNAVPVQKQVIPVSNVAPASGSNVWNAYFGIYKSVGTTSKTWLCDLFERAVIWKYMPGGAPRYTLRGLMKTGS
jgi:hypothetical protein